MASLWIVMRDLDMKSMLALVHGNHETALIMLIAKLAFKPALPVSCIKHNRTVDVVNIKDILHKEPTSSHKDFNAHLC
jgi:hypothetical protein